MSQIAVCRVCLAADVVMHHIRNTRVQEVFENLTAKKLTENRRPETICYLCYSQLQKCRKILDMYKKTENIFEQLANGGIEITENTLYFLKRSNIINRLVTPVTHIDILPVNGMRNTKVENINQVTVKKEKEEAVEVKVEPIEYDNIFEGVLDDNCVKSDESTDDSTLQMEPTHSRSKMKHSKGKKNINKRHTKSNSLKASEPIVIKSYTCDICKKTFRNRDYFKRHIQHHTTVKLYTCAECNQRFTFKSNLDKHRLMHFGKRLTCDLCEKTFSRSDHLKLHRRTHTGVRPYPCKMCSMRFTTPSNVQQHINSAHSSEKPFVCDVCGKPFSRKGNLQEHYRVHTGEKPYNCDKCDFKCSHKTNFTKHVIKMHLDC